MRLVSFDEKEDIKNEVTDQIRRIFFESSSRQTFGCGTEKEQFFFNWTDYYLSECKGQILLAKDADRVVGYLMGCRDSAAALRTFEERIPSYALFSDLFEAFPAHFHINCTAEVRGQGVGSRLVTYFAESCRDLRGLHLVTTPSAKNVTFYQKNGFLPVAVRKYKESPLLFMGLSY